MLPWLDLGAAAVPTWAVLTAAAAIVLLAVLRREALSDGARPRDTLDTALFVFPAAWLGARLGDLLIGAGSPLAHTAPGVTGSSLYGAGLAGAGAVALLARVRGLDAWSLLDRYAVAAAAALPLARLGCVATGCCFGKPATWPLGTAAPWGIATDPVGAPELSGIPLHPVALAEALVGVALFLVLSRGRPGTPPGTTALRAAVLYGAARAFLDVFRHPLARGALVGEISGSQLVAVVTAAAAAIALRRRQP